MKKFNIIWVIPILGLLDSDNFNEWLIDFILKYKIKSIYVYITPFVFTIYHLIYFFLLLKYLDI